MRCFLLRRSLAIAPPAFPALPAPPAPPALPAFPAFLAVLAVLALGCEGWHASRTVPHLDIGFAMGTRIGAPAGEPPAIARVDGGVGAAQWWGSGEGAARQYLGVAATAVAAFDDQGPTIGLQAMLAPPRSALGAGLQLRAGPCFGWQGDRAAMAAAVEWAHWLIGSVYAEGSYDLRQKEGAFVLGARVNLLFPYTLVKMEARPID